MYISKLEKFIIEATLLDHTNNDATDVSEYVHSINVKHNYIENSFPLYVVNFMLTPILRDKMRDNRVSLNLKVNKYTDTNSELEQDSTDSPVIEDKIIDTTIRVYDKPYTTTSTKTEDDEEAEDSIGTVMKITPYWLIGIPEESIGKNATIINQVYQNAKIDDILVNLVSKVEKTEMFIDPSDNVNRERSLLIPPLSIVPSLRYLQEVYGVYTGAMGIFFDIDKTSVYKILNSNRTFSNTFEIIELDVNEIADDTKIITPQVDEDENIRIYLKTMPDFSSNTDLNYDTLGETTVFNSYDYNFDSVKRILNNTEADNGKTRYYWNNFQNSLFEDKFANETMEISEGTGITLTNIDPSYFKIDTLYTIDAQEDFIDGQYSLIEKTFTLFTNDYASYNSMVHLKLTKLK